MSQTHMEFVLVQTPDVWEEANMRKKSTYFLILFLLNLLTACGKPGEADTHELFQTDMNRDVHDWRTENWQHSDTPYTGGLFYVDKYVSGLEYQPEQEYDSSSSKYKCWGSNFYALDTFSTHTGSSWTRDYYLSGYEDLTGEIWHQHIELPEMEEYGEAEKYISTFDIRNSQEYVLFVQIWEEDETIAYLAMHFSTEGKFLGTVDLCPAMQENGGVSGG